MSTRALPFLIPPEMVPINGLNPHFHTVSGARQVMFTGNLSQMLVIEGRTRKRQQSGLEKQHAEATFMHKFPRDAVVVAVIPRFSSMMWGESFKINPSDLVIYEDFETHQLDYIELTKFHVMHQHYGFEFKFDEDVYHRLSTRNERFKAGTVIATSPAVTEDGDYAYGLEAVVCPISVPETIEDGIAFSESFAQRTMTTAFETRTFTCGRSVYPINAYGNAETYKCIPDIGEMIHSNGLLAAFRPYDALMDPVYMAQGRLFKPVYGLDQPLYGYADAEVVDIRVLCNDRLPHRRIPEGMTPQLLKYWEAEKRFNVEIVRACTTRNGKRLHYRPEMTPRLTIRLQRAIGIAGTDLIKEGLWDKSDTQSLEARMNYRGELMDEFQVEVTYRYRTSAAEGAKLSDLAGGKGVGTRTIPDADMPRDKFGNVADIIYFSGSTVNRMNTGRDHERVIGAAGRDVIKRIRRGYGLPDMGPIDRKLIEEAVYAKANEGLSHQNFDYIKGFYEKLSPTALFPLVSRPDFISSGRAFKHLVSVIEDGDAPHGMYLRMPSDSGIKMDEIVEWIETSEYMPEMSEVTYRDLAGKLVTTKNKVLLGPNYYMISEKTATDWSGVGSARTNQFGTAARLTNADKHSSPGRETVTRETGEDEARNHGASHGAEYIADRFDLHNNPQAHRAACRTVLTHDTPTNIDRVIDRNLIPMGGHRPKAYLHQMLTVSGKKLVAVPSKAVEEDSQDEGV